MLRDVLCGLWCSLRILFAFSEMFVNGINFSLCFSREESVLTYRDKATGGGNGGI